MNRKSTFSSLIKKIIKLLHSLYAIVPKRKKEKVILAGVYHPCLSWGRDSVFEQRAEIAFQEVHRNRGPGPLGWSVLLINNYKTINSARKGIVWAQGE